MTFKDRQLNSLTFQALKIKFLNSMTFQVSMICTNPEHIQGVQNSHAPLLLQAHLTMRNFMPISFFCFVLFCFFGFPEIKALRWILLF